MKIETKLLAIQSKLKAPKNQYNSFGKYSYRSCEDILEGVKPLLDENKCTLTINDEVMLIGLRYYIKATATLRDCESEETISNTAFAREEEVKKGMDSSQVTGATSSYARKYALNGLFCIDDVKDADTRDNSGSGEKKKITTQQMIEIRDAYGDKLPALLERAKLEKLEDMGMEDASNLIRKLRERK